MKKVLMSFNEQKLTKAISKLVQKNGCEDLAFTVKTTKSAFLNEVATGNYDAALIMEKTGSEPWKLTEIIQIADSYNINLIPIISEDYKRTREIASLSAVGITDAVFIRKGGVYKADEILHVIMHPRTLREARMYYGIETYADTKNGGMTLATEAKLSDAIDYINANRDCEDIGQVLVQVLVEYQFDMAQAAELLEKLDEDMIVRLQKTVEYYELLDDLKKHDLIANYHIPREIRKLKKAKEKAARKAGGADTEEEKDIEEGNETQQLEDMNVAEDHGKTTEEVVVDAEEVRMLDQKQNEEVENDLGDDEDLEDEDIEDDEDSFSIAGTEESEEEDEYELAVPQPRVDDDDETDFSFNRGMRVSKESIEVNEGKKREKNEKKSIGELKKIQKEEKRVERRNELRSKGEYEDMLNEDEDEKKEKPNYILIGVITGLGILIIILFILFLKISIDRNIKAEPTLDTSGYDHTYNKEDVKTYEVSETGGAILKDEDGNVLYNASAQTVGNSENNEGAPAEEEMQVTVIDENENPDAARQQFNDTSGFEDGKEYKGLDLINLINSSQGADCILKRSDGTQISVRRGNASIEDFKPSAIYRCQKTENGEVIISE